ncbi:MAG: DUF5709 domain-containing protein [Nocardioidaceae bacterium]
MTENLDDNLEASEQLDQLQSDDTLVERGTDDVLDEGYSPPEHWSAAEKFGNTAREQAEGETLDQRLAQEEPDPNADPDAAALTETLDDGEVGDERAGRLVDPDQGLGEDVDQELIGAEVGIDGAAASSEEAAVHVVNEPGIDG